jgi:nucleoside-diphosphate-sugar epimerase
MHVFLAGSTGVLGRRVIPLLLRDGHRVTAMTRAPSKLVALERAGTTPVLADALDPAGVLAAVTAAQPDVVMHQLTDLAGANGAANAALRIRGTRNLLDAVRAAGTPRVVAQSIAWAYRPGVSPADEREPLDLAAVGPRRTTVEGVLALEEATRDAAEWVVLRYGTLYGPDTWLDPAGARADDARAGRLVADANVTSFLHVDDAAAAAVQALTWPSGAVNVCDDEPATGRDWVPVFCAAVGVPQPEVDRTSRREPWARGADNRLARETRGLVLRYPSWRPGFAAMAGEPASS